MIKILHCADLHLGDLNGPIKDGVNARRKDTLDCMMAIAHTAEIEKPDVTIIAGDLFNRSRVWADTALDDINAAINSFIRPLCRASEKVVLLFGTQNHDNPKAFNALRNLTQGLYNLNIYTTPKLDVLKTSKGEIQILAMPGFDKGRLRVFMPDADAHTENQNATTLVNEIIMGQAAQIDHTKPSILVAHYTVAGCESESGQTFLAGQDVVILPQTIDSTGVTLGCLGHIHKPQKLRCNIPAFYSGSPNQLTFNDEGMEHGFYIHEITGTEVTQSRFIHTPERRHLTVKLTQEQVTEFIKNGTVDGIDSCVKGAIIRIFYDATPEQEKALNRAALQSYLIQDYGAFHVADFIHNEADTLITEGVATKDNPKIALHQYLVTMQETDGKLTDTDIGRLEELAEPIIRQADDGRETAQHTGAFIPKQIEVTNYRSYTHAVFGFEDIRMAMVNGQNGVGKSSLFMDAIADCLYETSRDGLKGEWVRNGEKKGAIIFEFEMGGCDYRVARTRTKSKGTLALARKNPDTGEWENYSDTTMPLTQAKIIQTVGMDYQTFCSIALIRQDAYGLFLESDSDRRMEVLSSLLNLGIYDRAESIAKEKVTDQRRKLASLSDRMEVLNAQMAAKEQTEDELKECEKEKTLKSAQVTALEGQIQSREKEETLRQELLKQAQEKAKEAAKLDAQVQEKKTELQKQKRDMDDATALAGMADATAFAAEKISKARAELEPLLQDEMQLKTLTDRLENLQVIVQKTHNETTKLQAAKQSQMATLRLKANIEDAVKEMETVRTERQALAPRISEYDVTINKIAELKTQTQMFLGESRVRIGNLKNKIETAQKKAELLTASGCPIADKASCEFLKDAQNAAKKLSGLETDLSAVKQADKGKYEDLMAQTKAAKEKLESIGNPKAELDALTDRERRAAPLAAQMPSLEVAAATIAQIEKQEAEKAQMLKETEKEIADIQKKLILLTKSTEKARKLRNEIKANETTASLQAQCAAAQATVTALKVTIDLLTKDIKTIQQEAIAAHQEADVMKARVPDASVVSIDILRDSKNALARDIERIAAQTGGLQAKLDSIAEASQQWQDYKDEKNKVARLLTDYQLLANSFSTDGIQYVIIRSIVPEIQSRANAILSAMTGGKMAVDFRTERENKTNSKIVNNLDVWITSLSGGYRLYSSHSGGEKVKIALAVTLALADVKARRAGVQLGMLFIDEPPFLDGDGTDAYADALTNMANRNRNMRILAISHDPQLKARFSQNITVTAGENGSEVAME